MYIAVTKNDKDWNYDNAKEDLKSPFDLILSIDV